MSYIKNAYLDLSEELGLAPAQLLKEGIPTKEEILAEWQREVATEAEAGRLEIENQALEDDKYAYSNADAYEDYKSAEINGMGR